MRLNVYDEEVTGEVSVVTKVAETGLTFYGVRVFLASHDVLHHTDADDDRSAVTFWTDDEILAGDLAGLLFLQFSRAGWGVNQ